MSINSKKRLFILSSILLTCWSTYANTYKVISYDPPNPPHNIQKENQHGDIEISGVFKDIFNRIGEITGDEFIMVQMPAARGIAEFDRGSVDIEPGISPKWRSNTKEPGLYSISYNSAKEVIVFHSDNVFDVKTPKDLFGKQVGIVRGFNYPWFEAAFSSGQIKRILNKSESLLVKQLLAKRINQIFISKASIDYMKKNDPALNLLVVGDIVSSVDVMMRIHPSKLELVPRMNKALQQMIDEGSLDIIFAKYK